MLYDAAPSTQMNIIETFYLMLTNFSLFRDEFNMPWRVSYLLYHALTLQLNTCSVKSKEMTAEQRRIINMNLAGLTSRDTVRIMAYAGTGKTTTLVELTRRNQDIRFIIIE